MAEPYGPFSQEYVFGAGRIFGINTGAGAVPAAPTLVQPVQFLSLIEATVEETVKLVPLESTYEFPDNVADADRKLTGKITFGRVDMLLLNQLVFGETYAAGGTLLQGFEAGAIPATTPFTYTAANSATWVTDLGVYYASNGEQLEQVSAVTAAGEYSVAAGVYTFDAADEGKGVIVNYTYTSPTVGHNFTVNSKIMGLKNRPVFSLYLSMPAQGNSDMILYACRAAKLNRPFKRDDFLKMELDFEAYPNAAGQVYNWCSSIS